MDRYASKSGIPTDHTRLGSLKENWQVEYFMTIVSAILLKKMSTNHSATGVS